MPEKQRLAIENAAAGAGAPMSAHVSGWLAQRLASAESPPVRLKALELILSLRQRGSKEMQAALASGCGAAVELSTQFRCEPHPERGDLPQEMVQVGLTTL